MKKLLNVGYGSVHGSYWMSYAVFFSFASVFLLSKSYSNTMIGLILALGNLTALIVQPFVADFADRTKKLSLVSICTIMAIFIILLSLIIIVFDSGSILMTCTYIMIIGVINMMQPLINALSFKLQESGYYVNFGLTRSIGSMTYAILTSVLGVLVIRFGVDILPYGGIIVFVLVIMALLWTNSIFCKAKAANEDVLKNKENEKDSLTRSIENEEDIDIKAFIRRHKTFFILNIGVFGLFFSNQIMNGFMLQIVQDVGGTSKQMGQVFTLLAFLEMPTLIFYDKLKNKFGTNRLLKISAFSYICQIGLCYLSSSVTVIFAAQLFQPFSFALLLPSMVHAIDEGMDEREAVKGQSLFTMTVMLSTIVATFVGGMIIDTLSVKWLLLTATFMTSMGAFVIVGSIKKIKS